MSEFGRMRLFSGVPSDFRCRPESDLRAPMAGFRSSAFASPQKVDPEMKARFRRLLTHSRGGAIKSIRCATGNPRAFLIESDWLTMDRPCTHGTRSIT